VRLSLVFSPHSEGPRRVRGSAIELETGGLWAGYILHEAIAFSDERL